MNTIARLITSGIILCTIAGCTNSADKASDETRPADSFQASAPTVQNPAPDQARTPDTAASTPIPDFHTSDGRQQILTHIDAFLVPKAQYDLNADGMQNATVTLQNTLDNVTFQKAFVEVRITGDSGMDLRTDYLTFQNIEPGDIKTLKIKDAVSAHHVEVKVVKLKCDSITGGKMMLVGSRYNPQ